MIQIQKIVIGHEANGKVNDWHLKTVTLQTAEEQLKFVLNILLRIPFTIFLFFRFRFDVNKCLSKTQDNQQSSIELNRSEGRPPSPPRITKNK